MQSFIQTANQYGEKGEPFFFIIDFEQQKPLLFPVAECAKSGVIFDFFCKSNIAEIQKTENIAKPFYLNSQPIELTTYQTGFDFAKQQIQAGNSYLLNLTYPTKIESNYSLSDLFWASQAKYKLWFLDHFVCFSPECFVRIQQNKIYSYPMKGTINSNIPQAEQTLLNSEKEFSEHNTIVDLIRNDLALVASNIQVTKYRYIEKVKTHQGAIYQTSSEICGELTEDWQKNIGTILATLLPAGSISGAPKAKTVEIIQQAELDKRGYYTGVFGFFDGNCLESAVAIRYIEQQQQQLIFRSGGGITALSELVSEYQEILEKVYVPISTV